MDICIGFLLGMCCLVGFGWFMDFMEKRRLSRIKFAAELLEELGEECIVEFASPYHSHIEVVGKNKLRCRLPYYKYNGQPSLARERDQWTVCLSKDKQHVVLKERIA